MTFEQWLADCLVLISSKLGFDSATALRMVNGAGLSIYRDKFERGLTPQQCVDDELRGWNE